MNLVDFFRSLIIGLVLSAVLLCQRELPCVPYGFHPGFRVYSRVEIVPC